MRRLVPRVTRYIYAVALILFPRSAAAIPPPDFVVNAGLQLAQIAGIACFFCSSALTFLYRKYQHVLSTPVRKSFAFTLIVLGFGIAWYLALAA